MSAFMVPKSHIDYLLTAGMSRKFKLRWYAPGEKSPRELNDITADRVGAMLLLENRESVDYRYKEQELLEPYEYTPFTGRIDPVQVLKGLSCYEYQSCEHPEWEESEAHAFCSALRHAIINDLPGYEEAEWVIEPSEKKKGAVR